MNICSSSDTTPKPVAYRRDVPPASRLTASPIAARAAAMLMVLATTIISGARHDARPQLGEPGGLRLVAVRCARVGRARELPLLAWTGFHVADRKALCRLENCAGSMAGVCATRSEQAKQPLPDFCATVTARFQENIGGKHDD